MNVCQVCYNGEKDRVSMTAKKLLTWFEDHLAILSANEPAEDAPQTCQVPAEVSPETDLLRIKNAIAKQKKDMSQLCGLATSLADDHAKLDFNRVN